MVVEPRGDDQADAAQDRADQLVGEEVVGVVVPEEAERLGGAVDHHQAEPDQADDDDHQPAVDAGRSGRAIR